MTLYFNRVHNYSQDCSLPYGPMNTFYCRGVLGTRVNPNTIGCVWTGKFDLNILRVDREIFESGKVADSKYPDKCEQSLSKP